MDCTSSLVVSSSLVGRLELARRPLRAGCWGPECTVSSRIRFAVTSKNTIDTPSRPLPMSTRGLTWISNQTVSVLDRGQRRPESVPGPAPRPWPVRWNARSSIGRHQTLRSRSSRPMSRPDSPNATSAWRLIIATVSSPFTTTWAPPDSTGRPGPARAPSRWSHPSFVAAMWIGVPFRSLAPARRAHEDAMFEIHGGGLGVAEQHLGVSENRPP